MITALDKNLNQLRIIGSVLCMIHCMATPFLIVAFAGSLGAYHASQEWWSLMDILYLGISFLAVCKAVQQSPIRWINIGLMVSFILLTFFILNEGFEGIKLPVDMVYFPAIALVVLHIIKVRKCKGAYCEPNPSTHHAF